MRSTPFRHDESPDQAVLTDFQAFTKARDSESVVICGKLESEIVELSGEDRELFMKDLGLEQSGLEKVIVGTYATLGLCSYFTGGPQEVRAWTIPIGAKAPQAASVIHTDFEKGFIKADIYGYTDIDQYGQRRCYARKGLSAPKAKNILSKTVMSATSSSTFKSTVLFPSLALS